MKTYKEINKLLLEEGSYATSRLQKITFDLMKLVEDESLDGFKYRSNNTNSIANDPFINIDLYFNKEMVTLGMFEHLDEFPKSKKIIPKEIFEQLEEINGYLSFANTHLARDLPKITKDTYFSLKAAENVNNKESQNDASLVPEFMKEELPLKKKKLK